MEYSEIKKIIKDLEESKLAEVSIEFSDGTKISVKNKIENPVNQIPIIPKIQKEEVKSNEAPIISDKKENNFKEIKSPMVGTYYEKPAPNAKKFVEVGDKVKKGDILCIIEAMKLMNEIESEYDGEIVEILAKDGEIVDYGKPLFKIK